MKQIVVLVCCGVLLACGAAWAEDEWKKEYEAVCAQTDNAMAMSAEQLRGFVDRCDKIKPAIEGLEPSPRKVFLKRWQMCRDLYKYVLDSKDVKKDGK